MFKSICFWNETKKYLVVKEKFQYFKKKCEIFLQVLADTLKKYSENLFAYSCVSEHSEHFEFFPTKTYIFSANKGFAPPPLTDMSAKNVSFFGRLPLGRRPIFLFLFYSLYSALSGEISELHERRFLKE